MPGVMVSYRRMDDSFGYGGEFMGYDEERDQLSIISTRGGYRIGVDKINRLFFKVPPIIAMLRREIQSLRDRVNSLERSGESSSSSGESSD